MTSYNRAPPRAACERATSPAEKAMILGGPNLSAESHQLQIQLRLRLRGRLALTHVSTDHKQTEATMA